jgi:hypothetical protein
MISEKYLALFIGLLSYPGIDELEVRDAFLNVMYGSLPDGVPLLCDTPTFCLKLLSYVRQCDKATSIALSNSIGFDVDSDAEFKALARFVVAGIDYGPEDIEELVG